MWIPTLVSFTPLALAGAHARYSIGNLGSNVTSNPCVRTNFDFRYTCMDEPII